MAKARKRLALATVLSLMAISANFLGVARAHEDYPWVRNPQYVTATGAHCCSEQHCQPAAPGEMTPIPSGWRHNPTATEIRDDKPGIYQTEDRAGRLFRCVMDGKLVCVFEGMGT
jgi:hypothetical protein